MLLENLLRTEDGANITADHVRALAGWDPDAEPDTEIQFTPARVIMQDFTGVPCVVDLATMREAVAELGGDPTRINPLAPAELVIDHSVIIDVFGRADAFERNVELEYERNRERYQFLRWGQTAFDDFKVVPPGTGIVHQVNIEHLARVVMTCATASAYPDTCVGTDSHTTMVNGLGVLGWGVGGIEAEAAMLGQPVSMLIPRVVGFKLTGEIPAGATATDVVLTITEMLRKHGVVGKFVEFYGEGVAAVPLANRATIGNMSPEFGSTCAIFPIDDVTLDYLRLTGRSEEQVALVEAYAKEQGLWHDPSTEAEFSEYLELDLSTVVPSIAGPKRPQDRIALTDAKQAFREVLPDYAEDGHVRDDQRRQLPGQRPVRARQRQGGRRLRARALRRRRPAVEPGHGLARRPGGRDRPRRGRDRLDHLLHQHLQPVGDGRRAALLAKKAVEKGLQRKPWVKTSLAPGCKVVTNYYDKAGLTPYLEKLGFHLVGYGCTTCIGNSGPLPDEVSAAVQRERPRRGLGAVRQPQLRGPDQPGREDELPGLAAAGHRVRARRARWTSTSRPSRSGQDADGDDVFLRDIWPTPAEVEQTIAAAIGQEMFTDDYADVFAGDERWQSLPTPEGDTFAWDPESTYVRKPPYFDGMAKEPAPVEDITGARVLPAARRLGDHRPHQPGRLDQGRQPGGPLPGRARRRAQGLQLLRLAPRQPRGDDPRHVRRTSGCATSCWTASRAASPATSPQGGEQTSVYDAAQSYAEAGTPLVVLAGKEYGSGSSRDWAAKGTALLGVKAVIAESYERIHRSNLIGMGVLPLQYPQGETAESLGLDGTETFDITGVTALNEGATPRTVQGHGHQGRRRPVEFDAVVRIDTPGEADYYRNGGILQYVLRSLVG